MSRRFSRRELPLILGAGALAAPFAATAAGRPLRHPGRIGVATLPPPAGGGPLDPGAARRALEQALVAATGLPSARGAVAALFRGTDVVGIKVNSLGGPRLAPRTELVDALAALLRDAGLPAAHIVVFDRSDRELRRAGYAIRRSGGDYLCYGIERDYDPQPSVSGEIGSCFARLVSTTCTALVSFGVVKDHDLAGVSAGMKNLYGLINNPNKYHDHNCDPYVADVANHPYVRDKLRLVVLDGVTGQYHGGPAWRPDTNWPLGAVVASTDPLAADAWAWTKIDGERKVHGLPSLAEAKRAPRFLATAERYGLGIGDPARIREVPA
jgi:uncharacterized protein (DUF362 family)